MKSHLKKIILVLAVMLIALSAACGYLLQKRIRANDYVSGMILSDTYGVHLNLDSFSDNAQEHLYWRIDSLISSIDLYVIMNDNTDIYILREILVDMQSAIQYSRMTPNADQAYAQQLLIKIQPFLEQLTYQDADQEKTYNYSVLQSNLERFADYYNSDSANYTEIHQAIMDLK